MKSEAEHKVERMTLGLVLLALALSLFNILPESIDSLGALLIGIVLLGSAFYQRNQGWEVGSLTWVVGGIAFILGLVNFAGFLVGVTTAIAVLLLGLWLVGRGFGMEI